MPLRRLQRLEVNASAGDAQKNPYHCILIIFKSDLSKYIELVSDVEIQYYHQYKKITHPDSTHVIYTWSFNNPSKYSQVVDTLIRIRKILDAHNILSMCWTGLMSHHILSQLIPLLKLKHKSIYK